MQFVLARIIGRRLDCCATIFPMNRNSFPTPVLSEHLNTLYQSFPLEKCLAHELLSGKILLHFYDNEAFMGWKGPRDTRKGPSIRIFYLFVAGRSHQKFGKTMSRMFDKNQSIWSLISVLRYL